MKKLMLGLIILSFVGCGESKNHQMTNLLNHKKSLADSLFRAGYLETDFKKQARNNMSDSTIWMPLADSSTVYFMQRHDLQEKVKAVDFSIDSLSKMN